MTPLGPVLDSKGALFRIWAPDVKSADLILEPGDVRVMSRTTDGLFACRVDGAKAGQLYRFKLDGKGPFPDPASRYQPKGVHGPSQLVDTSTFIWSDDTWINRPVRIRSIYELHVGTFSKSGTFHGVIHKIAQIASLGVDAIELMPLADFPGDRNWGYDGVALFAPARAYGTPTDLQALVDAAHAHGLAVILDVVYNHFGPDGNYIGAYSPYFFSSKHKTNWGGAINLDGEHNDRVRNFFVENAAYWINEFHFDGLRLDATHAFVDDSHPSFLSEFCTQVRSRVKRSVFISAEDHRNINTMIKPKSEGGWDFDGVWADDLHHELRRFAAGDLDGYYKDYSGTVRDIVKTINQGWFYEGQRSEYSHGNRGTPSNGLPRERFVVCLQNHDQVGNRAMGERLHHQIEPAMYRALSALLMLCPETPLLFMGQEWAASASFLFFTDHNAELGKLVTAGRRKEFAEFPAFSDPDAQKRIPDPQSVDTFLRSKLDWSEHDVSQHREVLAYYRRLGELRRSFYGDSHPVDVEASELGDNALMLMLKKVDRAYVIVIQLKGSGTHILTKQEKHGFKTLLTSEEPDYVTDAQSITVDGTAVKFDRPGAVVLATNPATFPA